MKFAKVAFPLIICSILLSGFLLTGCGEKPAGESSQKESSQPVTLEGDNVVLARVNGSAITQYDLEQTIRSTLGRYMASRLDEAGRRKVLESMVASRAIAQAQEADLSEKDRAVIENKMQAYREELLVMQYLSRHAPPQPVTQEMVREYYESNPEQFGGKTIRTYEMITGNRKLKAGERDRLIAALKDAAQNKKWKSWVTALQRQGYPVAFRQGQVAEKILHPQLQQLMKTLKKGETSQLVFVKGSPYVVRIVNEEKIAPRPLSEVSFQIRKSLAPVQLKKSVKQAAAEVLETAVVVYEDGQQDQK